jgi:hypothetical protein
MLTCPFLCPDPGGPLQTPLRNSLSGLEPGGTMGGGGKREGRGDGIGAIQGWGITRSLAP